MVFIWKDGHVPPLSPLYEGLYRVLPRSQRTLRLQVGRRVEVVSVQHLKLAFTADDENPAAPRWGCPPHQPRPQAVPPDPPRR